MNTIDDILDDNVDEREEVSGDSPPNPKLQKNLVNFI